MYRLSRFLSKVAIISAILAFSVTYFGFPPIGFEGVIFISSVAVVLAIGSAVLSLILAIILFSKGRSPKPTHATAVSILSLVMAVGYIWAM